MQYISTRGAGPVDFETACLSGLAPDGGLFTPSEFPQLALPAEGSSYTDIATEILSAFAGSTIEKTKMRELVERAYASFAHQQVAPLVEVGPNKWMMELFHGPTLAFKDVAMQVIARIYDHFLGLRGERLTVLCATSGDTGGAAAAAFAGAENIDLFILHPHERISLVQRKFMTSTGGSNVHNFAIDGDFDDTQAIVKSLFGDEGFRKEVGLSGVNSINWTRIAAQSVYYASAQLALGRDHQLRFVVPTGNFGDALAGYIAARCGLLSGFECLAAVNANKALKDLLTDGTLVQSSAQATLSPAMDIQLPSNFERLFFEASGRNPQTVSHFYDAFKQSGEARLTDQVKGALGCMGIEVTSVTDDQTVEEMKKVHAETGWMICPHTAVACHAARNTPTDGTTDVILSTAHAAKFPETVERVLGRKPAVPYFAEEAIEGEEVFDRLPCDQGRVRNEILARRRG